VLSGRSIEKRHASNHSREARQTGAETLMSKTASASELLKAIYGPEPAR
jgi:hypothetical protein